MSEAQICCKKGKEEEYRSLKKALLSSWPMEFD